MMNTERKYVQFTCGRGPTEAARACFLVAGEFLKDARTRGCSVDLVGAERHNTAPDCWMSAMFSVEAPDAVMRTISAEWSGSLLYRSSSNPYRPGHKRRNWFVGCAFVDPLELPSVSERDITYESLRSGRHAGGQNQNVTESAVRATHVPTGISVVSSDERSNASNRSRARERLLLKLREADEERESRFRDSNWSNHVSLERGNPVKTFEGRL